LAYFCFRVLLRNNRSIHVGETGDISGIYICLFLEYGDLSYNSEVHFDWTVIASFTNRNPPFTCNCWLGKSS